MKWSRSDAERRTRATRVVCAGLLTGLLLAGCSSSKSASSTTSEVGTIPRLELGEVPAKQAVDALRAIFTAAGIDPDTPQLQTTTTALSSCPLGQPAVLTATPPAPVAGLDTKTAFTLERPTDPEPGIRCTFFKDLPADVANSIPASKTSSFLEYQVTYVPGPKLNAYLAFLGGQGYDQIKNAAVGGAIYANCAQPSVAASSTAAPSTGGKNFVDCGAIWLNSVVVVGMRFAGPFDGFVDVPRWLVKMIGPILDTLSKTTPASVVAATSTSSP